MSLDHLKSIYRNYDIRGDYPSEITDAEVEKIGRALVDIYKAKKVVVGHDDRPSAQPLTDALIRGVTQQGADVVWIGMVTTPMSYYASSITDAEVTVMVSASHMPSNFNGLKICVDEAKPIGLTTGLAEVRDYVQNGQFNEISETGSVSDFEVKPLWHKKIGELATLYDDATTNVVVDPANAVGIFELETLKQFGAKLSVSSIFDTFDSTTPNHEANPMKLETLDALGEKVVESGADIGIAFDGDADRIGIVDEAGTPVSQDIVGLLIAEELFKNKENAGGTVLYDIRSTKRVKEAIELLGGSAIAVPVGATYTRRHMRDIGAIFGLELSGHHFFKEMTYSEGGVLAALYLINNMRKSDKKLSELVAAHKVYFHTGEINSEVSRTPEAIYTSLLKAFPEAEVDKTDGLTLTLLDWWCNVRPSANDPVVRLNLEANTEEVMVKRRDEILAIIQST